MKARLFTTSMLLASVLAFGAAAQDMPVDFADLEAAFVERAEARFDLMLGLADTPRFGERRGDDVEVAIAAGIPDAFEISLLRRASLAPVDRGDATEVRIGRGLLREREPEERGSSAYAFIASNNEAVTWTPDARSEFGGRGDALALQDRVEVGDLTAGVTYERNGVQASLAYVEREESARVGQENFSQDQRFTGVTITMRR
jgi:hypothetical protein